MLQHFVRRQQALIVLPRLEIHQAAHIFRNRLPGLHPAVLDADSVSTLRRVQAQSLAQHLVPCVPHPVGRPLHARA